MSLILVGLIGVVCILVSVIIMIVDRKKRRKKSKLGIRSQLTGLMMLLVGITSLVIVTKEVKGFRGTEVGDRKSIGSTLLKMEEVNLNREGMTLFTLMSDDVAGIVNDIETDNNEDKYLEIVFINKLKSKEYVRIKNISEVQYSEKVGEDEVNIVRYIVTEKEKWFTLPQIRYLMIVNSKWK